MATGNETGHNDSGNPSYALSSWLNNPGDKLQAWMDQGGSSKRESSHAGKVSHATIVDATEREQTTTEMKDVEDGDKARTKGYDALKMGREGVGEGSNAKGVVGSKRAKSK